MRSVWLAASLLVSAATANAAGEGEVQNPDLALGAKAAGSTAKPKPDALPPNAPGQDGDYRPEQAAVYVQLLGPGVVIGLGASYRPIDELSLDAGVGLFAVSGRPSAAGVNPWFGVSWLSGGDHNLEVGAAGSLMIVNVPGDELRPFFGPHVGYRYQPVGSHTFVRALVHGVIVLSRELIVPWPGVALGASWGK